MTTSTSVPPYRFCDLVMKGGITSGVVYPLAAVKLSEKFIFKNIGGTSAGAIAAAATAAAATAAAEMARASGGFERLNGLPKFICGASPQKGKSNLFAFFQPQPETRRLFEVAVAALGKGWSAKLRVGWRVFRWYFWAVLFGSVPAGIFFYFALTSSGGWFLFICALVAAFLLAIGVLLNVAFAIKRDLTSALPENFYGLCSGMADDFKDVKGMPPAKRGKPLTYWLTEYLNEFVGRKPADQPLTFGELWGTRDLNEPRKVNLEMMTTCITHGRPYRLPFRDNEDVRENNLFYFMPDEFRKLFPESVVKWMEDNPRPLTDPSPDAATRRESLRQDGFRPLPAPPDLPVVVAVRMSLSFPILLSAVPLHAVDRFRDPDGKAPERCWFSDGGVCSNFPIHFFDSPLPRWPTLSINLVEKPAGTEPADLLQPEMPKSNGAGIQESWNRFEVIESLDPTSGKLCMRKKEGLPLIASFVWGLITTMQNWSDNTQSRLPGYRDRIARVGLTGEEGGLNLDMPKDRIDALTARGDAVGAEFIRRFDFPAAEEKMNWDNHRWLRMRSCLSSLESLLEAVDRSCADPQSGDNGYQIWIENLPIKSAPGYDWTAGEQKALALKTLKELRQIMDSIKQAKRRLADEAPRPRPELRPRAQI